jgi:hypothetical protein
LNFSENFVVQVGSFEVNNAAAHLYVVWGQTINVMADAALKVSQS